MGFKFNPFTGNLDISGSGSGSGSGESNTASNVGTAGVGVFKQKTGVDLEFKKINAGSSKITVSDDLSNSEVDIDVSEANINHDALTNYVANEHIDWTAVSAGTIDPSNYVDNDTTDHTLLSNIGTNSHAQIDTHIADSSIHFLKTDVTAADVGLGNVDNTSDANKPVSTAQQTALDLKYDASNPSGYIDSAGAPVQPSDIANFETTTELNARDTANRDRANHTGIQTAATISDFDTEVSNNVDVVANTTKVTNATHTGEVTGSTALVIDKTAISGKTLVTPDAADHILIGDASDTDNLKKVTVQSISNILPDNSVRAAFNVYRSTSQTIPTGAWTKISFFSQRFDAGDIYSVDLERFISPDNSFYLITSSVRMNSLGDLDQYRISIFKNDSLFSTVNDTVTTTQSFGQSITVTAVVSANIGDYFDIRVYHTFGANRSTFGSSSQTYFCAARIGA